MRNEARTIDDNDTDTRGRSRPVTGLACMLVGIAAAVLGLLPWLVTGARLPIQDLWRGEPAAEAMPVALLPFSQYELTTIIGLLVTGSAVAGLVGRNLRRRMPAQGLPLLLAGVLVVQLTALVQTTLVVQAGLQDRQESALYLLALDSVAVLSVLVGLLAFLLTAMAPRAGALVGLAMGALALGPWLTAWVQLPDGVPPTTLVLLVGVAARWVPPILVGLAIAWAGLETWRQAAAALAVVLLTWVVPPLITAIQSAAGSRVLAGDRGEMLDQGVRVFISALTLPAVAFLVPLTAAVVAAIAMVAQHFVSRS
ncbi:hypothetical protein LKO27_06215 [Tessaracoccus sp. OS52]|uniref:hypothetical protein n=1 Tax=Tessaracoccus sp. OS52 TaxID=2886691 RepID=UPI001D129C97|nr:hypothetical protein [Tessaracoccus sp. OS52]MCC2593006.1 hypothetical protein [Tessaracoccus sp. OS52]